MVTMSKYVALYCRISEDKSGRAVGVKDQEKWGREYAAETWPDLDVRVFCDNDLSAAKDDVRRPEYEKLREAVKAGEVAHLCAIEQSRLERSHRWFVLADELDSNGVHELHTAKEGVKHVMDVATSFMAVMNKEEVRVMRWRVNKHLKRRAQDGEAPGSKPFGYRHGVTETGAKTYYVIPDQAAAIHKAAKLVLSGWSLARIAEKLNEDGVTSARGGKIGPNAVRSMVTKPTFAGKRVYRGEVIGEGNWEPILDELTWMACRAKLSQPRYVRRTDGGEYPVGAAHNGNSTGRRYLLTGGLAVCGTCKAPLIGTVKQMKLRADKTRDVKPYLTCHPNRGGKGCVGIMLDPVEQYVTDELFEHLDKPEVRARLAESNHTERRNEILKSLATLDQKKNEIAGRYAIGEMGSGEWKTARDALERKVYELTSELNGLPVPTAEMVEGVVLRELWPDMTLDERRSFLRRFCESVTVKPGRGSRKPGTPGVDVLNRVVIAWVKL